MGGSLGLISPHPVSEPSLWNPPPREPDQPPLLPPKTEKMKRKVKPAMLRTHTSGWGCGCPVGVGVAVGKLLVITGDICGAVPSWPDTALMSMWCKPSQIEVYIRDRYYLPFHRGEN